MRILDVNNVERTRKRAHFWGHSRSRLYGRPRAECARVLTVPTEALQIGAATNRVTGMERPSASSPQADSRRPHASAHAASYGERLVFRLLGGLAKRTLAAAGMLPLKKPFVGFLAGPRGRAAQQL